MAGRGSVKASPSGQASIVCNTEQVNQMHYVTGINPGKQLHLYDKQLSNQNQISHRQSHFDIDPEKSDNFMTDKSAVKSNSDRSSLVLTYIHVSCIYDG